MEDRDDLGFAHRMADFAGEVTTDLVRVGGVVSESKSDGSPVTPVDVRVEHALRALVARERPEDAFWGEESGEQGEGPRRWVVDPVDGARSLLAGEPEWGTLIALTRGRSVRLGLVSSPALERRWWAVPGGGAWTAASREPKQEPQPLEVTATDRMERAAVGTWPPSQRISARYRTVAAAVASRAGRTVPALDWAAPNPSAPVPPKPSTGSGTCHGGLLVATGRLDAFLLLGAGPWDLAALVPIVREAGGSFSDLNGRERFDTGAALFGNARIHDEVLDAVRAAI